MKETDIKTNNKQRSIVISAGGTGGHFFPAKALATDLISRGYKLHFISDTRGRRYKDQLPKEVHLHILSSGTLKKGLWGKISGAFNLGLGLIQAFLFMIRVKPDVVVGFGGYPSFPAVFTAQKLGIATVIHEQNSVIGKANKVLAKNAARIACSFPDTDGLSTAEKVRSVVTGNPVRKEVAALYTLPFKAPSESEDFHLYIFAGSQGAKSFSEIIPEAIIKLPEYQRNRLYIWQQCKEDDIDAVKTTYANLGIKSDIQPFFSDVDEKLANAHLVIARGGASTISEIVVSGRPAIFVPYPYHIDEQQKKNALNVVNRSGAWLMEEGKDFEVDKLTTALSALIDNPQKLFETAEAARQFAIPDAARKLGNVVNALAMGWESQEQF